MEQIRLFRRRFLPDEVTELKDDTVLFLSDDLILTKWNVLKPRKDIAHGISAYFIDLGIKVSKVYNASEELVYWYCDIVEPVIDKATHTYTFNDLLVDVLIYPEGRVRVVDLDEFADILEKNILTETLGIATLRRTDHLLRTIYAGNFHTLTDKIDEMEKTLTKENT